MTAERTFTPEEAQWEIFSRASEVGKFAAPLSASFPEPVQRALEFGQIERWWTLIDIAYLGAVPGSGLARVYLLTDAGWYRRGQLAKAFAA